MSGVDRPARRRAILGTSSLAHFVHDGFSDVLYLLLPLWQAEFGLSLAQVGVLKTFYSGAMAAAQTPAGFLAERLGERALLVIGTAVTAISFTALGLAGGMVTLALVLMMAGAGSATQHPLSSSLVSKAYEDGPRRAALGIYNFSGDLGKAAVPPLMALIIIAWQWRWGTVTYGLIGLATAACLFLVLKRLAVGAPETAHPARSRGSATSHGWGIRDRWGYILLSLVGIIDGASRAAFLTFFPFLLIDKGAGVETLGLALALVFGGGAAGKFLCGLLAERIGIIRTILLTELLTVAGILVLIPIPLPATLVLLPLVGIGLNGTSSVLYATIADFVVPERRTRGFGLFYTLGSAASALSPAAFGLLSDQAGVTTTLAAVAASILLILPLSYLLRPSLAAAADDAAAMARK
ncbi:MAG: MFS transporter [Alphaproteobacteria bacterium]|nr:MFS transporter [Alphaproteobacteria bacterium]